MAHIRNIPLNEACCTTLEGVHDQLWSNGLEVKWARHKEHEKKLGQADRWHLVNEEEKFEVHLCHVKNNAKKRVNRLVIQGKTGWKASKLDQVKVVLTAQRFYSRPPNHDPEMMKVPLGDDECSMTTDNFNEVRRWHGPRRWGRVAPISEDLERLQTKFEEETNDGSTKRMKILREDRHS